MPSYRKRSNHEPDTVSLPASPQPGAAAETAAPSMESGTGAASISPSAPSQGEMDDLRKRLHDMEAAQQRHREAQDLIHAQMAPAQTEQPADPLEAVLSQAPLPDRAKSWLREHPEFLTDPRKNAALTYHHWQAVEQHPEYSDEYFLRMEELLGLSSPAPQPEQTSSPPPKTVVRANVGLASEPPSPQPVAQPEYRGPPLSAPPTREVPSMVSGQSRPSRVVLSAAEQEMALLSKPDPAMSDLDALRLYAANKQKFESLRKAGAYPQR